MIFQFWKGFSPIFYIITLLSIKYFKLLACYITYQPVSSCITQIFTISLGKQVIHPAQISVVNSAFSPSAARIQYAAELVEAFEQHQSTGKVCNTSHVELLPIYFWMKDLFQSDGKFDGKYSTKICLIFSGVLENTRSHFVEFQPFYIFQHCDLSLKSGLRKSMICTGKWQIFTQ